MLGLVGKQIQCIGRAHTDEIEPVENLIRITEDCRHTRIDLSRDGLARVHRLCRWDMF